MAAAGQGTMGLRSWGGPRGCIERLAGKASCCAQEKRGSEERTGGEAEV